MNKGVNFANICSWLRRRQRSVDVVLPIEATSGAMMYFKHVIKILGINPTFIDGSSSRGDVQHLISYRPIWPIKSHQHLFPYLINHLFKDLIIPYPYQLQVSLMLYPISQPTAINVWRPAFNIHPSLVIFSVLPEPNPLVVAVMNFFNLYFFFICILSVILQVYCNKDHEIRNF